MNFFWKIVLGLLPLIDSTGERDRKVGRETEGRACSTDQHSWESVQRFFLELFIYSIFWGHFAFNLWNSWETGNGHADRGRNKKQRATGFGIQTRAGCSKDCSICIWGACLTLWAIQQPIALNSLRQKTFLFDLSVNWDSALMQAALQNLFSPVDTNAPPG